MAVAIAITVQTATNEGKRDFFMDSVSQRIGSGTTRRYYFSRFMAEQLSLPPYGYAAEVRATRRLFLIRWNLWQNRRLQQSFFFLSRIHRQTTGSDQARGHENDQVALNMLVDIGAK